ncbi:MAG: NADH-quinone oxidoreductase subunit N [Pseudomonadota bacterium]
MNWILDNRQSLGPFLPEMVLTGGALVTLLMGAFLPNSRRSVFWVAILSLLTFLGFSFALLVNPPPPPTIFSGAISADSFAVFFKIFFGIVTIFTAFFSVRSRELEEYPPAELLSFLLALTLGMSMMAASTDLLMMFLSLEMVSVLSYVLVGYKAANRASSEAGLKYILYGGVASGVMVFGFSFLFGLVGSTDFVHLTTYFRMIHDPAASMIVFFSLLCVLAGLGYKMATFPTQMWCPDVYEGAPIPVTTFLSVGPKAAGFAMAIRFFYSVFSVHDGRGVPVFEQLHWGTLIAVVSAVTMTVGNLAAIPQRNLKRMMAYSSIAHAGYMLMAFATLTREGIEAILFYLITYLLMNLGAFFVILVVSNELKTEEIEGYRGLGWRAPILAVLFVVFLCSLIGLPPFAGFIGKLYLFSAVINRGMYWLAGVAALNTVVSLFFYFRVVKAMFLEEPTDRSPIRVGAFHKGMLILLAVPTLILGIYWKPIWLFAAQSVGTFF